jgi:hypothetical protein
MIWYLTSNQSGILPGEFKTNVPLKNNICLKYHSVQIYALRTQRISKCVTLSLTLRRNCQSQSRIIEEKHRVKALMI